jgi:hypothetical protein
VRESDLHFVSRFDGKGENTHGQGKKRERWEKKRKKRKEKRKNVDFDSIRLSVIENAWSFVHSIDF